MKKEDVEIIKLNSRINEVFEIAKKSQYEADERLKQIIDYQKQLKEFNIYKRNLNLVMLKIINKKSSAISELKSIHERRKKYGKGDIEHYNIHVELEKEKLSLITILESFESDLESIVEMNTCNVYD